MFVKAITTQVYEKYTAFEKLPNTETLKQRGTCTVSAFLTQLKKSPSRY